MYGRLAMSGVIGLLVPTALHYTAVGYLTVEEYAGMAGRRMADYTFSIVGLARIASSGTVNSMITDAAVRYHIKPEVLHALAVTESNKNPEAVSTKGAIGVLQVMPFNYKRCNLDRAMRLLDEKINIDCGAKILSEELKTYKNNMVQALKAYNGGANCVKNSCKESETYVLKIGQELLK